MRKNDTSIDKTTQNGVYEVIYSVCTEGAMPKEAYAIAAAVVKALYTNIILKKGLIIK